MEGEVSAMQALLTTLGTGFTQVISWVGNVIGAYTASGNELLLLGIVFFVVGGTIGIVGRLWSRG